MSFALPGPSSHAIDPTAVDGPGSWTENRNGMVAMLPNGPDETRNAIRNFDSLDAYFGDGGGASSSGLFVSPSDALMVSAVFACRRVIAEDIAMMPRQLVRITYEGGRRKTTIVRDHPLVELVEFQPNEWMTPFTLFEHLVRSAVIYRGGYMWIVRDGDDPRSGQYSSYGDQVGSGTGKVLELLPLLPGSVSVSQDENFRPVYNITGYGETFEANPGNLLKLHGPMDDRGLDGVPVNMVARNAIGLAMAVEGAVARFHKNDLRPSGVLTSKQSLNKDLVDRIREEWQKKFGIGGIGGIAVLDAEFDFKAFTATSADSQTVQNRLHQIEEICRFFRVMPTVIGHNSGTQAYGSPEAFFTAHFTQTLRPWVQRLEEAMNVSLLTRDERESGLRWRLDVNSVERGTFTERVNAYNNAIRVFMTPNEVREEEGLDADPDPNMDRVQLQANNTGMHPGGANDGSSAGGPPKLPKPSAGAEASSTQQLLNGAK